VAGGVPSQAAGEEPAKTSALADMSKQIVASISSTTTVEASGSSSGGAQFSIKDKSTIKSAIKLPDAQIVARCFDPQQATMYALAAVDKAVAQQRVSVAVDTAADKAAREMKAVEAAMKKRAPMEALPHLLPAREGIDEVETQLIVLRAIGGNYKGTAPTRSQFKDLARSLRSKLRVTVIATGEGCKQVAAGVVERLTKLGVEVQTADRAAGAVVIKTRSFRKRPWCPLPSQPAWRRRKRPTWRSSALTQTRSLPGSRKKAVAWAAPNLMRATAP